jgi:hypothetical protein
VTTSNQAVSGPTRLRLAGVLLLRRLYCSVSGVGLSCRGAPSSVYEPDFYGWCEEHRPETAEAEQEVLEEIKYEPREDWLDRIRERVCLCPGMHLDNDNQLINIPDGLTAEEQTELRNLAIDSAPGWSHKE